MMKYFLIFILLANVIYAKSIIEFKNLHFISKEFANNIISSSQEKISKHELNRALRDFYKLGYFKDIKINTTKQNKNTKHTFYFIPNNSVKSIKIQGLEKEESGNILAMLPLKRSSTYTYTNLIKSTKNINNFLEQQGFFDSQILIEQNTSNNNSDIKISINKGQEIILKHIYIQGNHKISSLDIKANMILKQKDDLSFIPFFFNDGKINEQTLLYNKSILKDFYLQKGFFDFKLKSHRLIVDFDNYTASLFIEIDEGILYTIGNIDIQYISNDNIENDIKNDIKKELSIKIDDIFNISSIRYDIPKIQFKMQNLGYAFVNIVPDVQKDNSKINITYKIHTGSIVTINDVLIKGNTKTRDYVIRRDVFLAPQDKFNQKDFRDSISALKRTGFFSNVVIEKSKISNEEVDLIVIVKEAGGTNLNAGGGHSSQDGLFINAAIKETNTLGSGISNSLKATISKKSAKYNYEIINPRIFNSLYNFTFNIYNTQKDVFEFDKQSVGVSSTFGKQFTRFATISSGGGIDNSIVLDKEYNTTNTYQKNSIFLNSSYNNTNNFLFPSSGYIHRLSLTYSGFGGDVDYLKIHLKSAFYKSLLAYDHKDIIFSYKAQVSHIIENKPLASYDRLYLGGVSSVRGYRALSLYPIKDKIKGGLSMFSGSIDVSFPLQGDSFRLSVFADYGTIGNDAINEIQRASYGLALQIITPSLPIVFLFPKPLLQQDSDSLSNFEFMLGNIF